MRHLGFGHNVAAIRDIGYVYADDGQKIIRLSEAMVDRLASGRPAEELGGLVGRYPGLFTYFDTADEARGSLHAALTR
ncbi:hypothetical protein DN069_30895 [Streptacidiphilus pinicola]|uniref:Uncharacterized protein n=1 Tax=Streptacidiphilus pinicola TaxID=2219663 RepID=A0A2X0J345_9ACTN|nr:hypothetical protein [Streptacidiphilus pinicola]RAG81808.1 hypothetical protein DN069_30895 [Streptacidiphilus pinicola]